MSRTNVAICVSLVWLTDFLAVFFILLFVLYVNLCVSSAFFAHTSDKNHVHSLPIHVSQKLNCLPLWSKLKESQQSEFKWINSGPWKANKVLESDLSVWAPSETWATLPAWAMRVPLVLLWTRQGSCTAPCVPLILLPLWGRCPGTLLALPVLLSLTAPWQLLSTFLRLSAHWWVCTGHLEQRLLLCQPV